jgi:hypothetical protein
MAASATTAPSGKNYDKVHKSIHRRIDLEHRLRVTSMQVAFWPASFPSVSVSAAQLGSWEGDLLLLAVTEEEFVTESEAGACGQNCV